VVQAVFALLHPYEGYVQAAPLPSSIHSLFWTALHGCTLLVEGGQHRPPFNRQAARLCLVAAQPASVTDITAQYLTPSLLQVHL